jgi:hypothetical protein
VNQRPKAALQELSTEAKSQGIILPTPKNWFGDSL